ncbi:uncharacterized protein LOC121258787 [Juglans microcarpa x Juglans regia]|uniref:uncharacterized protein LOC121258787 n=1 Tax=Juglans microcarpa x Juglans regia TaxID=2249226 RepID=UPI001B7E2AB2|nr:uncharacterized protein LOC121258787 [Juglans microcarpa x Juglans regia]
MSYRGKQITNLSHRSSVMQIHGLQNFVVSLSPFSCDGERMTSLSMIAIFRSLLYKACGRLVNPIYGSVWLLWLRSGQLCQSAVEAMLKGALITAITSKAAASHHGPPLKAYEIRLVLKDENSVASKDPHRVKTRCRFKRSVIKPRSSKVRRGAADDSSPNVKLKWDGGCCTQELNKSTSHESSLSHQSMNMVNVNVEGESKETENMRLMLQNFTILQYGISVGFTGTLTILAILWFNPSTYVMWFGYEIKFWCWDELPSLYLLAEMLYL